MVESHGRTDIPSSLKQRTSAAMTAARAPLGPVTGGNPGGASRQGSRARIEAPTLMKQIARRHNAEDTVPLAAYLEAPQGSRQEIDVHVVRVQQQRRASCSAVVLRTYLSIVIYGRIPARETPMPRTIGEREYFSTQETAAGISKAILLRWLKSGHVREPKRDRQGWRIFSEADLGVIKECAHKIS